MPGYSVCIVIAAYNEARVIARVVAEIVRAGYRAVVVDDCSTDATAAKAADAGAVVARHAINLGQGAALQTGMELALAEGADFIVTFDGDGQHRVADVAVLLNALQRHQADFALGSRHLGGTVNQPVLRRMLLTAATWFTRFTTGLDITDTHNGLRAMTRRGAGALRLRQNRMAHASEILTQIAQSGLKYVEAPVTVEYTDYSLAKGQRLGDAVNVMMDLFARSLHR